MPQVLSQKTIWGLVAGLSGLIAVLSLRFLVVPLDLSMDHMAHYLPDWPVPLYGHIIFAPLALAVMPLQFWEGLRVSRPRLHRALGYLYVLSVLIAGISALGLQPLFKGSGFAAAGFAALAIFWLGTTLRAVLAARARDFRTHRVWMIRSATLTFAAVTLRVIMAPLMASGWSVTETYDVTAWGSWVPLLIGIEMWIKRRKIT